MSAMIKKEAWSEPQFECPRCGHCCHVEEEHMSREAMQLALNMLNEIADDVYCDQKLEGVITTLRQALVDADDTSQKRVDKMVKTEHETLGSEWAECVKLPIVVHVRNQREGETHISTREGITPVLPDDLIMRGVAGEEYPIGRELFERTYTFDTAPPKKQWVGLTDEEIVAATNAVHGFGAIKQKDMNFAKAIEAKLKERNT